MQTMPLTNSQVWMMLDAALMTEGRRARRAALDNVAESFRAAGLPKAHKAWAKLNDLDELESCH